MKDLRFEFVFGVAMPYSQQDEWQRNANGYRVTFGYGRRQMTTDYWMGSALTDDPECNEVMHSLIGDAQAGDQSFGDFCADLGYDTDSRRAERIYKGCQRIGTQLSALFGADFFEALQRDWEGSSV